MTEPVDFVLRIALVRGDESHGQKFERDGTPTSGEDLMMELSPSVWRRFKVSSHVNLDLLHDKVLVPLMGWTRNFRTYLFRKLDDDDDVSKTFIQLDTNASDVTFAEDHLMDADVVAAPESVALGTLLENAGDRLLYIYDLMDCWYHIITVEERITGENANGRVEVLDGAMRCPPEFFGGCYKYQSEILDLVNQLNEDPYDHSASRQLGSACWLGHLSLNVRDHAFRPEDFSVVHCQESIQTALRARNWARTSVKVIEKLDEPDSPPLDRMANAGQQFQTRVFESDRTPSRWRIGETVQLEPDPLDRTLCCGCGNPLNLRACGACHCAQYCSSLCQREEWRALHRGVCNGGEQDDRLEVDLGVERLYEIDPARLRFSVGDAVECRVGDEAWATGHVVQTLWRCPVSNELSPYQIKVDARSFVRHGLADKFIHASWDHDNLIRARR